MFALKALVAAALALAASAAPSKLHTVQAFAGPIKANSYIVTLKADVTKDELLASQPEIASSVTHGEWDARLLNGFAGVFNPEQLNALRASDAVASIVQDGIYTIQTVQTDAAWGLGRLSSNGPVSGSSTALNYTYIYDAAGQGRGVDVYVVDTGINTAHVDFGGRASFGFAAGTLPRTDDHGHGTHVAGIATGTRYGVAKAANAIAVKVLNSAGSGTTADVVSGFNYVLTAAAASGRPSIASASLGGGASTAIDAAVQALVDAGVHVVVAAGNSNVNAANTSPARVSGAITVAASSFTDSKASFSNFGPVVDIWGPITSAFIGSNTATHVYSGTSQATPHVSGLAAVYISLNGNTSPANLSASLWSVSGALSGVPSGTVNRLAHSPATA
ncbi:subtilisin-like protein [Exidia glandulosa HHB12029]|uniref:Subtilisin-like protein n=1 Tax=Exidia glandulosa HHB12029 TaxID=1314781 RepID=A0A165KM97_EXIGL|nr:subtilisin-like protein [Exidia glandulosa HHB12029]